MGKLTAVAVKAIKEPGRYSDGQGLLLEVKASGARSWIIRIQWNGKRRDIGLGSATGISLSEARERAAETRKQVRAGIDPVEAKRASRRIQAALPTFREAAECVHKERKGDWKNAKHREQWISTLRTYAFPHIGNQTVDKTTAADVRDLLQPIWQSKPETASRVLQRVLTVLNWAHVKGYRPNEAPKRAITIGLGAQKRRSENFPSLPHDEIAALSAKLRKTHTAGRLALRFVILTATRSGEVRKATWEEIDLQAATWTIPASRMKAGREQVVPLSPAALDVLKTAAKLATAATDQPLFPGLRNRPLSDMTLTKTLRTEIGGRWTVHGFRSSLRDWAAEKTSFRSEAAEAALAHVPQNKVVAAYLRTKFLDERREMMARWAEYVDPQPWVSPI